MATKSTTRRSQASFFSNFIIFFFYPFIISLGRDGNSHVSVCIARFAIWIVRNGSHILINRVIMGRKSPSIIANGKTVQISRYHQREIIVAIIRSSFFFKNIE